MMAIYILYIYIYIYYIYTSSLLSVSLSSLMDEATYAVFVLITFSNKLLFCCHLLHLHLSIHTSSQSGVSVVSKFYPHTHSNKTQDRYLPIANIARIMKNHLPENAKIAKDSKETVQECVSEFISFITSEASDKCMQEKRKTINGDDLLWAMSTLGFDKYVEPLKLYLAKYREAVRGDKPEKSGSAGGGSGGTTGRPPATAASAGDGVGVPPPSKKSKKK